MTQEYYGILATAYVPASFSSSSCQYEQEVPLAGLMPHPKPACKGSKLNDLRTIHNNHNVLLEISTMREHEPYKQKKWYLLSGQELCFQCFHSA